MRYYTEQYSKSNSIEKNRIKSIWNKVEWNGIKKKSAEEIK